MPKRNVWIIKLGGSLIGSDDLNLWLAAIAHASHSCRVILVPGGGAFADVVRSAQNELKIDDLVAHEMALLSMRQFGLALVALCRPFVTATLMCVPDIQADNAASGLCIWDPCDPYLGGSSLPRDWRVTSDSLSLWLCGELENSRLVLVKSTTPEESNADLLHTAANKFVDDYFPILREQIRQPVWWMERTQADALSAVINGRQQYTQYIGEF